MKILLVQKNSKLKDRLNLYLDNLPTSVEVIEASDFSQVKDLLEQVIGIDVVLTCHETGSFEGMKIAVPLLKTYDCDLIVNTEDKLEEALEYKAFESLAERGHLIGNDVNCEMFHNLILDVLKRRKNLSFEYTEEEYRKVRLIYFLRCNKVLCDVFIKIGDEKYIKVLKKDDIYTRDDLQKYRDKKVKYLFVQAEDYEEFGAGLSKTPFLIEDRNLDPKYVEDAVINTLDIVHEMVSESGVTDEVINLVDYSVFQIENTLEDDKILSRLLASFRDRKDYLLDHSYMVAYFSNSVCAHMEWDSEEIRKKLSYAAMLQDLCLADADLAMAINLQTADMVNYTDEQISYYKSHPQQISELVKKNPKVPMNVDEILLSHHEKPEGNGFPRALSSHRVTQLAAVFNVAHSFVDELYREEFDLDQIPTILSRMKKRFSSGNYQKPFEGLLNVFKQTITVSND